MEENIPVSIAVRKTNREIYLSEFMGEGDWDGRRVDFSHTGSLLLVGLMTDTIEGYIQFVVDLEDLALNIFNEAGYYGKGE